MLPPAPVLPLLGAMADDGTRRGLPSQPGQVWCSAGHCDVHVVWPVGSTLGRVRAYRRRMLLLCAPAVKRAAVWRTGDVVPPCKDMQRSSCRCQRVDRRGAPVTYRQGPGWWRREHIAWLSLSLMSGLPAETKDLQPC